MTFFVLSAKLTFFLENMILVNKSRKYDIFVENMILPQIAKLYQRENFSIDDKAVV